MPRCQPAVSAGGLAWLCGAPACCVAGWLRGSLGVPACRGWCLRLRRQADCAASLGASACRGWWLGRQAVCRGPRSGWPRAMVVAEPEGGVSRPPPGVPACCGCGWWLIFVRRLVPWLLAGLAGDFSGMPACCCGGSVGRRVAAALCRGRPRAWLLAGSAGGLLRPYLGVPAASPACSWVARVPWLVLRLLVGSAGGVTRHTRGAPAGRCL